MIFLPSVKGTYMKRFYNKDFFKNLNFFNIQDRIEEIKWGGIAHLNGMQDGWLSKNVWQYKPIRQSKI